MTRLTLRGAKPERQRVVRTWRTAAARKPNASAIETAIGAPTNALARRTNRAAPTAARAIRESLTARRPTTNPTKPLPATTLARLTGHADAGFTLRVYARDRRDDAALAETVIARAATAGVGV